MNSSDSLSALATSSVECVPQVSYVDVYSSLLDEVGQLAEAYTTDGLHLSVAGYRILAQALQETL